MSNYNIELVQQKTVKASNEKRSQYHVVKKNNTMLTFDDVEIIYNQMVNRGIAPERIAIIGLNAERLTTIKSLKESNLFEFGDEDYLNGKSQDIKDKLSQYFSIDVILY